MTAEPSTAPSRLPHALARRAGHAVPAALTRYRVMAWVVCDLALRARWSLRGTVLVLLAGTVPVLSFLAERHATRRTRAGLPV